MSIHRRVLLKASLGALALQAVRATPAAAAAAGTAAAAAPGPYLRSLRNRAISIGLLLFERMDQIDFTGPFAVLARVPDATLHILGHTRAAIRDHKGLVLTPQLAMAEAPELDVLVVPGGPGQQALMHDAPLLDFIARHGRSGRVVFSVCTGALLCGAAGLLHDRRATTHWAAAQLLPLFGATLVDERVVVDGDLITAAGVTAGIDGALVLAALLRGEAVAQDIQLDIQYAPEPRFAAGSPRTAPPEVLRAVTERYRVLTEQRRVTALEYAARGRP
jgi:cyclohexyl-isocyanide hydratase